MFRTEFPGKPVPKVDLTEKFLIDIKELEKKKQEEFYKQYPHIKKELQIPTGDLFPPFPSHKDREHSLKISKPAGFKIFEGEENSEHQDQESKFDEDQYLKSQFQALEAIGFANMTSNQGEALKELKRGRINIADTVIDSIDSRLEKMRLKREIMLHNNEKMKKILSRDIQVLNNTDFYPPHPLLNPRKNMEEKIKDIEFIGSPTIENVEEALKLHRMKLHEIEQLYYIKKGMKIPQPKITQMEDQNVIHQPEKKFLKRNNFMQEVDNEDIIKEYKEPVSRISVKSMNKSGKNNLIGIGNDEELEEYYEKVIKDDEPLKKATITKKKKLMPTEREQYEQKFEDYLIDRTVAKNSEKYMKSLSKKDFDNNFLYVKPDNEKTKLNEQGPYITKILKEHTKEDALISAIDDEEINVENQLQNEAAARKLFYRIMKQKIKDKKFKKETDLKFILKTIWRGIDKTGLGVVSKQEVYDTINQDENVQIIFDIDKKNIYDQIKKLETKRNGLIDFKEFSDFMSKQVKQIEAVGQLSDQKINNFVENKNINERFIVDKTDRETYFDPHLKSVAASLKDEAYAMIGPREQNENYCILNPFIIKIMKDDFDEIDKAGDQLISREQFMYKLRTDKRIIQLLERPAIRVPWTGFDDNTNLKAKNNLNLGKSSLKIRQKLTVKKVLDVEFYTEEEIQEILRVNLTLTEIIHPNIAQYTNVERKDNRILLTRDKETFNLDQYLEQLVLNSEKPSEDFLMNLLYSLIEGAFYLKSQKLINHNNIKPSNILISDNNIIKICDAGCMTPEKVHKLFSLDPTQEEKRESIFIAPEIIRKLKTNGIVMNNYEDYSDISDLTEVLVLENESDITCTMNSDISEMHALGTSDDVLNIPATFTNELAEKIDVFSIGMIILRAINFEDFYEMMERGIENEVNLKEICMKNNVPPMIGPLLNIMLNFDTSKRPNLSMIRSHLNIKKWFDINQNLMKLNQEDEYIDCGENEKLFSLEEIINVIEEDYENEKTEAGKKAKEFITWNNFIRYFEKYAYHILREKLINKRNEYEEQEEVIYHGEGNETLEDKIEIKPVYLLLLQDVFDAQKRFNGDFVYTTDFVISAKRDPQIKTILSEPARATSQESGLKKESIGEYLDRIIYEAPEKVRFKNLTDFLTRRGRPKYYNTSLTRNMVLNMYTPGMEEEIMEDQGNELFREKNDYTQLRDLDDKIKNFAEEGKDIMNDVILSSKDEAQIKLAGRNNIKKKPNTVAEGPSFLKREKNENIRERKFKEMVDKIKQEEDAALKFRVKVLDIPEDVKNPKLADIAKKEEDRKQKLKDRANDMKKESKPPSFLDNDLEKRKKRVEEIEKEKNKKPDTKFIAKGVDKSILEPKMKNMVDVEKKKEQANLEVEGSKVGANQKKSSTHQEANEDKGKLTNLAKGKLKVSKTNNNSQMNENFKKANNEVTIDQNEDDRITNPKISTNDKKLSINDAFIAVIAKEKLKVKKETRQKSPNNENNKEDESIEPGKLERDKGGKNFGALLKAKNKLANSKTKNGKFGKDSNDIEALSKENDYSEIQSEKTRKKVNGIQIATRLKEKFSTKEKSLTSYAKEKGIPEGQIKNDVKGKLEEINAKCKKSNTNYRDEEFPPVTQSITLDEDNPHYSKYFLSAQWLRPPELFKCKYSDVKIFDNIDPNDIKQGSLGDCYFLATLSALAKFPDRIKKIFNTQTINEFGAYSVTIYLRGIPTEIIIDDYFPCFKNQPLFAKPVGKELWVMILEKAWAKCFKQYTIAEGGLPHQAMEHMIGAPSQGFSANTQSTKEKNIFQNPEELGNLLKLADDNKYLLSAGTKGEGEAKSDKGMVAGHAYTLISVHKIEGNNYLLKMRNPWGSFEWKGEYGDDSEKWTEDLKIELNYEQADDGVFFMTIREFIDQFDQFCVCYIHDNFIYSFQRVIRQSSKSAYFKVIVSERTKIYFRVHQLLERLGQNEDPKYKYSSVEFHLYDMIDNKCEKMLANGGKDRHFGYYSVLINNEGFVILEPGNYLLKAKVMWHDKKAKEFIISTYSDNKVQLDEISNEIANTALKNYYINIGKKNLDKIGHKGKFSYNNDECGRYILYAENNDVEKELTVYFDLGESLNIKVGKLNRGSNILEAKLNLAPKQNSFAVAKYILKNGGGSLKLNVRINK